MASTKIYRPGYVNDFTYGLINDINNAKDADYANLQYSSLNEEQNDALQKMMSGEDFNGYVDQLMGAGEEGINQLNNVYNRISDFSQNGNITPDQIEKLTSQLYNRGDVEEAINASNQASERQYSTETAPNAAMQANLSGGFGSAQRLGKARAEERLVNEEQANANQISSNAYNTAQTNAINILNANQANNRSALAGLASNAVNQAGLYSTAGALSQQSMQDAVNASQQQVQDQQNKLNVDYANRIGQQNQVLQNLQNRLQGASFANGVLGQTKSVNTSGGGSGILGGMVGGAVSGFMVGGPYGALAGAAIGGASAAAQ